jgi:hypothetical protein
MSPGPATIEPYLAAMLVIRVDATQLAVVALQASLTAVLLVAGLGKGRSVEAFAGAIRQLDLVATAAERPVAYLLVAVEIVLGAALLLGVAVVGASLATCALFLAFSLVTTRVVLSRREVPCGCFGAKDRSPVTWRTPGRSLILAGLAGMLAILAQAAGGAPLPAAIPTTIVVLLGWAITIALRRVVAAQAMTSAR